MTASQRHRGPDDHGVHAVHERDPGAVLGHRRLAVIDLSPGGHQPMIDPGTGAWLVLNGEIYNYRELRAELRDHGHRFVSETDAEVLLKAHAMWGDACVGRLRGMFAFAIWQPARNGQSPYLLLARDHLGVKPLYYATVPHGLLFASELRAILASGLIARRCDPAGLRSYLGYGSVQEPLTLVRGIHSLPPAHTLAWREGTLAITRYWRLPSPDLGASRARSALVRTVRDALAEAARLQLVADVPLGAFLSGGTDSTAVTALAQEASGHRLTTVSLAFDEREFDEGDHARLVAQRLGTKHHAYRLTAQDVAREWRDALAAFDQPSVDGLNTYFVSRAARQVGLTVALSGVGGDEVFGGYDGYRRALLADRWASHLRPLPDSLRRYLARHLEPLARTEALRKAVSLLRDTTAPYRVARQLFDEPQATELLLPELGRAAAGWDDRLRVLAAEAAAYDPVNRASALELGTYMVSTLLRDTDQMSMAHGLEVRVPLLDHRLVETVFQVRGQDKVGEPWPKPLLTKALGTMLPAASATRPKQGFELPFDAWLRGPLRDVVREALLAPLPRFFPLRGPALAALLRRFETGTVSWSRVWSIVVLRSWLAAHRIDA
jgi:asparagine synthase (glutamine-hydrolysing)